MIKGEKIYLRTVREADLDALFVLFSDLDNRGEYYPLGLPAEPIFKKDFQENGFFSENKGRLLICDQQDRIVGIVNYFKEPSYFNGLELGYILFDQASRNRGYVTEAVGLLVKYLFATRMINRIQILVLPENVASKKVAEKNGFKFEGVARGAFYHHGKNCDAEVYSILRDEVSL